MKPPAKPKLTPEEIAGLTLSPDAAAALFGRSRAWFFNIVKEGHIAKEGRGQYSIGAIMLGVPAYYEALQDQNSKTKAASRASDARAREVELRIAEKTRELIPIDDANLALDYVVGEVNKQFTGLAARITRDVSMRRKIEAAVYEAKHQIAEALAGGKDVTRTGIDPAEAGEA